MNQIPFTKFLSVLLIFCLIVTTVGCTAMERVTITDITHYEKKPIVVIAPGGSQYRLKHWSRIDSAIVCSEGEVNYPSMSSGFWGKQFQKFSGKVPTDSVAEIKAATFSLDDTFAGVIVLTAVVGVIVLALVFGMKGGFPES